MSNAGRVGLWGQNVALGQRQRSLGIAHGAVPRYDLRRGRCHEYVFVFLENGTRHVPK